MKRDPVRQGIRDLLWRRGLTMKEASLAIGRSPSYMHQFLERGTPRVLAHADAVRLADLLGCALREVCHPEAPRRRPQRRRPRTMPPAAPGAPLVAIPEIEVDIAGGLEALEEALAAG